MKKFFYLVVVLAFSVVACDNGDKQTGKSSKNDNKSQIEKQYYYILDVFQKGETYYASIQLIDFLYGDEALERAEEYGYDDLPNDYYIDDNDQTVITVKIDDAVEVISWAYSDMLGMYKMIYYGSDLFVKFYESRGGFEETPFVLEIEDNKIEKIEEQYVP